MGSTVFPHSDRLDKAVSVCRRSSSVLLNLHAEAATPRIYRVVSPLPSHPLWSGFRATHAAINTRSLGFTHNTTMCRLDWARLNWCVFTEGGLRVTAYFVKVAVLTPPTDEIKRYQYNVPLSLGTFISPAGPCNTGISVVHCTLYYIPPPIPSAME